MMTDTMGVQSAAQICRAVEDTLKKALPMVLEIPEVKAYLGERAKAFRDVREWQQLPTIEAIASAQYPAVAIVSPGLVEEPVYSRADDAWKTKWRVAVGIYDRSRNSDHGETQDRIRDWVAFIRTALLRNPTLGGVVRGVSWAGEEYDLLPDRNKARTIGAGALAVDIRVDVPNTLGLGLPPVSTTSAELAVNPHQE
jgi:hypothetical protein